MRDKLAPPDQTNAEIATRQHGIVTLGQLIAGGLTRQGVSRRVAAGRLHRVFRGVYAVGHTRLSSEGRWFAAVAACGEAAVLSHRSAAELWTLLPVTTGLVHVTVAGHSGRAKRRGLVLHRSPSLTTSGVTLRNRIRVTTPARTIADLRRSGPAADLRRALRKSAYLGLDIGGEERVSEGEGDGSAGGKARERSELERRFLQLCHKHGLPLPHVNVPIGLYTVDFLWPERRLAVETDGWQAHRGRQAFEDDRERDAFLRLRGFEVVRFSWRQITEDSGSVVAVLRRYLV
jgi:very-short-patch-repair endonuclease